MQQLGGNYVILVAYWRPLDLEGGAQIEFLDIEKIKWEKWDPGSRLKKHEFQGIFDAKIQGLIW